MSIIRIQKQQNFKTIDNRFLERTDLSGKAKAVLAYLVSRPDDWEVRVEHMVKCCFKEGSEWVYSALKELEKFGYVERKRIRNHAGRLAGIEYTVFEVPQEELVAKRFENKVTEPIHEIPEEVQEATPIHEKPSKVFDEQAIYKEITKKEIKKKENRQRKALSVSPFSSAKIIGDELNSEQMERIEDLVADVAETTKVEDLDDLVAQIAFVMLDPNAFSRAGRNFGFKLNSIAKVIRSGRWEMPTAYAPVRKANAVNIQEQERKSLRIKINHLQSLIHSAESAAKMFSDNAELAAYHRHNAEVNRQQLLELQGRFDELLTRLAA